VNIGKDTVVTITYVVRDLDGKLMEESDEPVSYLHGGYDNIFPLVEQALEGKSVGETVDLKLQPADAFGEFDEDLVRMEPREAFPPEIEIGMQFVGFAGRGWRGTALYRDRYRRREGGGRRQSSLRRPGGAFPVPGFRRACGDAGRG